MLSMYGCFGGGGSSGSSSSGSPQTTGKALNNYLGKATVSYNTKNTLSCEDEDSSNVTTTDEDGNFTLPKNDAAPLLAIAKAGEATKKDEDDKITTVAVTTYLMAPPGYTVISPYTTQIWQKMTASGGALVEEDAIAAVMSENGVTTTNSVTGDYIALLL